MVVNWTKGAGEPNDAAVVALAKLHQQQQKYADELLESWDRAGRPAMVTIEVAADDESARRKGWPSVGAQMVAPLIAQTYIAPARIVLKPEEAASPAAEDGGGDAVAAE